MAEPEPTLYDECDPALRAAAIAAHSALHTLWTRAVDAPGYNKADWIALDTAIEKLVALAQATLSDSRAADEADDTARVQHDADLQGLHPESVPYRHAALLHEQTLLLRRIVRTMEGCRRPLSGA